MTADSPESLIGACKTIGLAFVRTPFAVSSLKSQPVRLSKFCRRSIIRGRVRPAGFLRCSCNAWGRI
jgi:hypothetical protein